MKRVLVAAAISVASIGAIGITSASATPEVPMPPANEKAYENGAGIGCDMGLFHSELAKDGMIGKERGHYPGQHEGASVCKAP